jgi:hypothetical protein
MNAKVFKIKKIQKIALGIVAGLVLSTTPINASLQITSLSLNTLLHFGSGFFEKFTEFSGRAGVERVNLKNEKNSLSVLSVGFRNLAQTMDELQSANGPSAMDDDENIKAEVVGKALCYPNPFRQETGTQLGYRLSKNMNVQIHLYDMLANLVIKKDFNKGALGARKGYNKVDINLNTLDGHFLSAGVYFYLLINNSEVLSRGKMAVIP